jgi:hypothetical protein
MHAIVKVYTMLAEMIRAIADESPLVQLPMWMEREQRRRDLAHEQAQVQKIVDEHEKQRLAQAKAALTKTRPKTSSSGMCRL